MINFMVNLFTSTLLSKHRKTQYTFSLSLLNYQSNIEKDTHKLFILLLDMGIMIGLYEFFIFVFYYTYIIVNPRIYRTFHNPLSKIFDG